MEETTVAPRRYGGNTPPPGYVHSLFPASDAADKATGKRPVRYPDNMAWCLCYGRIIE